MLLLVFQSGNERYGLDAARIVEVAPLAALKTVPGAPAGLAGLLNYRGSVVPVVDLAQVMGSAPAAPRLSTRIVIVNAREETAAGGQIGFLVERATETIACREADLQSPGVTPGGAPYLGRILLEGSAMIQRIDPAAVLTKEMRNTLTALTTQEEAAAEGTGSARPGKTARDSDHAQPGD